ncbi:MAG: phosphate signaling complex protein PhoU [Acidimicrobiales bacterium]|nr:phosphate signaling complex protein PhoU [Acidimicrobiales bacterium]
MPDEIRKNFHRELDAMRQDLAQLAAMTAEMVTRATDALLDGDLLMAQAIIDHDDEVDVLSADIEHRCFRLLALQNPMAADLRVLAASMRINSDLERSADLAVNIVKGARRIYGHDIPPRLRGIIARMSEQAVRMLAIAMDAYAANDGPLGAALHDIDNQLDQLQRDFIEAMFQAHDASLLELQPAVQLALIARYFERIGDHAVNIGERVAFIASGETPEHPAAERIRLRAESNG